jgi:hypothetical protein
MKFLMEGVAITIDGIWLRLTVYSKLDSLLFKFAKFAYRYVVQDINSRSWDST